MDDENHDNIPAAPATGTDDTSINPRRHPSIMRFIVKSRARLAAAIIGVIALMGAAFIGAFNERIQDLACDIIKAGCRPAIRTQVIANPDIITSYSQGISQAYVTTRPASSIPAPPYNSIDCRGRYDWAHNTLGAVNAIDTYFQLDITATRGRSTVNGFRLHLDGAPNPPIQGVLLTCPGKGGGDDSRRPHLVDIDLDKQRVDVLSGGNDSRSSFVDIGEGATQTFVVNARTVTCECKWRLEVFLLSNGQQKIITVGPDGAVEGAAAQNPTQQPFETTAASSSPSYLYVDGKWVGESPSSPPPNDACNKLIPQRAVDVALGTSSPPAGAGAPASPIPVHGASGLPMMELTCVWQSSQTDPSIGLLNLFIDTLQDRDQAQREAESFVPALREATPNHPEAQSLLGLGDRAYLAPGWVIVIDKSRLIRVTGAIKGNNLDPILLQRLAKIVLASG